MAQLSDAERAKWCKYSNKEASIVSLLALLLAFCIRMAVQPFLEDNIPTFTFIFATFYIAWKFGYKWGIFELIAGFLVATYFFVKPYHSFVIPNIEDIFRLVYFFSVCLVTIYIFEKINRDRYESAYFADLADKRFTELVRRDRLIG